jgi:hypothetical protein
MEGKKFEQGKFSFLLGNSKPQKIPLVTPKMQPMTSLPQGKITSFFTFLVITTTVLIKETVRDGVARNCKWNEERSE